MRSFLVAVLILMAAARLQAQDSLPRFVFAGHHIGDAQPKPQARLQCKWLEEDHPGTVCARENLDGVHVDAAYTYTTDGRLVGVGALVDSTAFKPLLSALTRRYGEPKAERNGVGHEYVQWRFREGQLHLTRAGSVVVLRFSRPA